MSIACRNIIDCVIIFEEIQLSHRIYRQQKFVRFLSVTFLATKIFEIQIFFHSLSVYSAKKMELNENVHREIVE